MNASCHRLIRLSSPLFILLLLAAHSRATTVVMLSDEELIVDSRIILTGKVHSVFSAWDDAGDMIWTYVEIRPDRMLKGNIRSEMIVLRQMGGTVGLAGIEVFGQPSFTPGSDVLLFLNTSPDGTLHTAHSFMGMFSIEEDSSGTKIATRVVSDSVNVIAHSDTKAVTDSAPFEDYIRKIEDTLQRAAARISQREAEREGEPIFAVPPEYAHRKRFTGYSPAFVFINGGVRWFQPDSGQAVFFNYNPNNSPTSGGGATELTRAMNAWPQQSEAIIQLRLASQTQNCGLAADGSNVISFGDCRNQLDPPSGCSGVVATTQIAWNSSETRVINGVTFKRLMEADIVFNRGMDCFLGTSANLAEVACHELGHAIGLGHSSDSSALMYASARGRGRDATLGLDDKTGVLAIYSASQGGNPTGPPQVRRVKVKSSKKIFIYGDNFSANSLVLLNGVFITPRSFSPESGKLNCKGSLNLRPEGFNTVQVISGGVRSTLFRF